MNRLARLTIRYGVGVEVKQAIQMVETGEYFSGHWHIAADNT